VVQAAAGTVYGTATIMVNNAAPTVATPAGLSADPVAGTTVDLSVLGDDDGGESNLSYTWAATTMPAGAAGPTFSGNGSNAAKNTTATFSQAGAYGFTVTITDAGGLSTTSSIGVTVDQTLTSIVVSPANASLRGGASQQCTASAQDQFGQPLSSQPEFTWSATQGSIDATGLYTARYVGSMETITAAGGGLSGTATVTITVPTLTWSGAGGDDLWSTPDNWVGGVAPSGGEQLVFSATTPVMAVNDYPSDTVFSSITLTGTDFTLAGNQVALDASGGAIIQSMDSTNTVALPIRLLDDGAITVSAGSLTLSGPIQNDGHALTLDADALASLSVQGAISGSGSLRSSGGGQLSVSGPNTSFSGLTTLTGGTLSVADPTAMSAGGIVFAGGNMVLDFGGSGGTIVLSPDRTAAASSSLAPLLPAPLAGEGGNRDQDTKLLLDEPLVSTAAATSVSSASLGSQISSRVATASPTRAGALPVVSLPGHASDGTSRRPSPLASNENAGGPRLASRPLLTPVRERLCEAPGAQVAPVQTEKAAAHDVVLAAIHPKHFGTTEARSQTIELFAGHCQRARKCPSSDSAIDDVLTARWG
jgi:hypothetical protein